MPILKIHHQMALRQDSKENLVNAIRNRGSKALNTDVGNIWVLMSRTELPIAEDQEILVVEIMANVGRSDIEKASFAEVISSELASAFSVPEENIWIHFQELDPRNIWLKNMFTNGEENLRSSGALSSAQRNSRLSSDSSTV